MMRETSSNTPITAETYDTQGAVHRNELLPTLMIAWASDPARVGEVAFFEEGSGAAILGRGGSTDDSSTGRAIFYRQCPERIERMLPLSCPSLSREQLRIRPRGKYLHIDRIGKCPMIFQGERADSCALQPGDLLLLKGQLLLFFTLRPRFFPPLRAFSLKHAHAFGKPDGFGIVGESIASWKLRDEIAWTARADQHTLLLGESGSGKELAARAIHALSERSSGPFVARNAATIPESLIDAELFGNTKNYPNPGMPERPGLIGAAHGGTLFLDEIGELPPRLQANLLRVLDEGGEYHNLGGSAAKRSNFRLLGATNRDPATLKHDLGARLVLRLNIPGLDERRDDIPFLIRHLLERAASKNPEVVQGFLDPSGRPILKPKLVEHAMRAHYTTHIRELDALLWRAMAASDGNAIDWREENSRPSIEPDSGNEATVPSASASEITEPGPEDIRATLEKCQGNIMRTAKALGLSSRYVLYRLMRKHGIEVKEPRGEDE